jgi:MSHA pilin protein MshD
MDSKGREAWGLIGHCFQHARHFQHPCRSGRGSEKAQIAFSYPGPRPQALGLSYYRGVALIELVLSIVIVAIAASAVLGLLSFASKGSADAMVRNQAVAIAQAYLEEIRLKEFLANGVESSRGEFNDVSDYHGLSNSGAYDQFGNAIVELSGYNVTVSVGGSALGSITATNAKRIDVIVQNPAAGVTVTLSGYRTSYQ